MSIQVSLEDAYRTACATIGELVVRERLLTDRVAELTADLDRAVPAAPKEATP